MQNMNFILQCLRSYESATIDRTISPKETMLDQSYFEVGRSAIDAILVAAAASTLPAVNKVLDLPCGHGRVLRHLVHLFPGASFDACDLDRDGVEFCATTFGARAIHSVAELTEVTFDCAYDVIWVGSLFTHTAEDVSRRWMAHLARFLTPNGIVIATLHGRWCVHVHNRSSPYVGAERWSAIYAGYLERGYGYHDYARHENHSFISGSYGISLAAPHATLRILEAIPGIRIFLYLERAWGDHHDVVAFGRPSYDLAWPGMKDIDQVPAALRPR